MSWSLVRSLRFACTFIETPDSTSPTLWVGTNRGHVMAFLLSVPEEEGRRRSEGVEAVLAKEIQLKHMAPVIDIEVGVGVRLTTPGTGLPRC